MRIWWTVLLLDFLVFFNAIIFDLIFKILSHVLMTLKWTTDSLSMSIVDIF